MVTNDSQEGDMAPDNLPKLSHAEHVATHHAVARYRPVVKSFSHGVEASTDVRIQALRRAFDNDGYAVYWTLVERVYANGGKLRLREPVVMQEVAGLCWVTTDRLVKIISWCCGVGLFARDEWEVGTVVTSSGIRANIEKVIERRRVEAMKREKGDAGEEEELVEVETGAN